jgi:hypothetical protein
MMPQHDRKPGPVVTELRDTKIHYMKYGVKSEKGQPWTM